MKYILVFIFAIVINKCECQVFKLNFKSTDTISLTHGYGDKPGNYTMVVGINEEAVNAGDEIILRIFFSGYGNAEKSKLFFMPSVEFYDTAESFYYTGYKPEGQEVVSDPTPHKFDPGLGGVFSIDAINIIHDGKPLWKNSSTYFDVAPDHPLSMMISTEGAMPNPPFQFVFATKKDLVAGLYSFHLVYSYFNGIEWKSDEKLVSFKINNVFEEHPVLSWLIPIIIGILFGFPALFDFLKKYFIFNYFRFKKTNPKQVKNLNLEPINNNPAPSRPSKKTNSKIK